MCKTFNYIYRAIKNLIKIDTIGLGFDKKKKTRNKLKNKFVHRVLARNTINNRNALFWKKKKKK